MGEVLSDVPVDRGQVPSEREVALGFANYEFIAPPPRAEAEPVGVRRRIAELAGRLDPRAITAVGPRAPLILLFLAFLVGGFDLSAFGVLLKEVQLAFHFDLSYLIVLGSVVEIVTFLLAPLTGFLADRVSRVKMVAIGNFAAGVAVIGTGAAPSVAAVAGSRVAGGLGASVSQPAGFPLVTDWYPMAVRARVFAFIGLGTTLGALLGPTVAGTLATFVGWRATFLGLGVLPLLVGVGFLVQKEPVRGALDREAMGATAEVARREQAPVGWAEGLRSARSIVSLRRIWYAVPFITAAGAVSLTLLALYFADVFGVSPLERGLIASISGAFGVAGLALSGPIGDRLMATKPSRLFTLFATVLTVNCVLIAGMVASPVLWMAVVFAAPLGFGQALALPALFTFVSTIVPARYRAFGLQTVAPFQVIGLVGVVLLETIARSSDIRLSLLALIPVFAIGAALIAAAGAGVEHDIRAARSASLADEEARRTRDRGGNRMLICRGVDVMYEGTRVLFNIDLDIEEGELLALLGTNGAGKSTLLRAISGIQEASDGAVFLDGVDITHRPPHLNAAGGIVFMPGGQAVFPTLTVAENLRAAGWLHRNDKSDDSADGSDHGARIDELLDLFPQVRDRLGERAGNLSGGEQQMVALCQAFLMRPRLLMIDELSLGLAPAVVEPLLDVVRRINAAGTTVVLVEQSVNVALTIAHRAVFLDKGQIRFDGPTADLLGRSDLVRSVFLGGAGGGETRVAAGGPMLRRPGRGEDRQRVLAVDGLEVGFGGRKVLDGTSVEVQAGAIVGVIGPNGAGKTTLFDVISGYVDPDAGTVAIAEASAKGLGPDARARLGLGRSFQNARMFPSLTVRDNIAVALELKLTTRSAIAAAAWLRPVHRSEERVRRRVDNLIDLLELHAYADKFAGELSTGTRRMLDLACVMAAEPHVLLLDEPSSGLAQAEVEMLGPLVRRLARESGCGILVTSTTCRSSRGWPTGSSRSSSGAYSPRAIRRKSSPIPKWCAPTWAHRRPPSTGLVLCCRPPSPRLAWCRTPIPLHPTERELSMVMTREDERNGARRRRPRRQPGSMTRDAFRDTFEAIRANVEKVIKGKADEIRMVLTAMLADGHVLLEDMPGTGKTMMARAIAQSIEASVSRVQCTPDLLPSDITGSPVFDQVTRAFSFRTGPVFANVLLVDEINRATPKTQSALLEAMQERRVSVDKQTYPLPKPFLVLATQNPVELAGTFPLPEAQLDRFLLKLHVGYPDRLSEAAVLETNRAGEVIDELEPVVSTDAVIEMMRWATGVAVAEPVQLFIVDLCQETRTDPALMMGASPRASLALMRAARVLAASQGREDVTPDDVKLLVKPVLGHRLILTPDASLRDETVDNVIDRIVGRVKIPLGI